MNEALVMGNAFVKTLVDIVFCDLRLQIMSAKKRRSIYVKLPKQKRL